MGRETREGEGRRPMKTHARRAYVCELCRDEQRAGENIDLRLTAKDFAGKLSN